jgi:hypothetical protein
MPKEKPFRITRNGVFKPKQIDCYCLGLE